MGCSGLLPLQLVAKTAPYRLARNWPNIFTKFSGTWSWIHRSQEPMWCERCQAHVLGGPSIPISVDNGISQHPHEFQGVRGVGCSEVPGLLPKSPANGKSEIVSHLESLRKKANPAESKSLRMILPENPEDLHYLSVFDREKAAPPRVDLEHLHHMVSVLPLRKTHRHSSYFGVPGHLWSYKWSYK